jgi:hypothetical protein
MEYKRSSPALQNVAMSHEPHRAIERSLEKSCFLWTSISGFESLGGNQIIPRQIVHLQLIRLIVPV